MLYCTLTEICTNVCSNSTFWITNDNKLYANGNNYHYQLGLNSRSNTYMPRLDPTILNPIDVQCAYYYSIALCTNYVDTIVLFWYRKCLKNDKIIPIDIFDLLISFCENNCVYSTGYNRYGGSALHTITTGKE